MMILLCGEVAAADEFVRIAGGAFRERSSGVTRRVEAFEMGKHPVTNADYAAFVAATRHPAPENWPGGRPPAGQERLPVVFVNRYDAAAYVAWRSAQEQRVYRLPTRAEFEFAARGGRERARYPWGDEPPAGRANFDPADERDFGAWARHLRPVGSYPANGYGLHDMAGNVWHWVEAGEDPVRSTYKFRIQHPADLERVVMGGSWARGPSYLECGHVSLTYPGLRHPDIGFRLVREPARGAPGFTTVVRRVVALAQADGAVFLSWQSLPADRPDTRFNVYRSSVRYEAGERVNAEPLAGGTQFVDRASLREPLVYYRVRPVDADGREGASSEWAGADLKQRAGSVAAAFVPRARPGDFSPVFGDLDGDGLLDCVLRFKNGHDETAPDPGLPVEIEAYAHGGRFLWRQALVNHPQSYGNASNVPVVVFDIDGDGRSEVLCRMAHAGSVVLAALDGRTGEVLRSTPWPPLLTDFARSSSRILMGIAYLDGKSPAIVTQTGLYENEVITAYDGALRQLWEFRSTGATSGSGSHRVDAADVDGDGRDEVLIGSTCLNSDGTLRWSIYRQHADHVLVRDFLPERPGREIFYGIETNVHAGVYLVAAESGKILWKHNREADPSWQHVHSAWAADILPDRPGIEIYASRNRASGHLLLDRAGEVLVEPFAGNEFLPLEWDAAAGRELVHRSRHQVVRFDGRAFVPVAEPLAGSGIAGHVTMVADLLGDFRDEIVVVGRRGDERGVFVITSASPTARRALSATSDREYRLWLARNGTGGYSSYFEASHPARPRLEGD